MMIHSRYYVAWNRDDAIRVSSTSGGVFSALADVVLEEGGIIIGAAYDKDINVRHEIVDSREGLKRLRGVKYVHGAIGPDVYAGIKDALNVGRKVLFSGLPCQVAAMRKMFGANANLLLVDLVCFGAPPHQLWRKYVDWLEAKRGKKLVNINPRDKKYGWGRKTYYRYEWADGTITRQLSLFDPYAQAFYSSLAFADGCFRCPFKGDRSRADITIGDGWGLEQKREVAEDAARGVSCLIVRTWEGEACVALAPVEKISVSQKEVEDQNFPITQVARKPQQWKFFADLSRDASFSLLVDRFSLQRTKFEYINSKLWDALMFCLRPIRKLLRDE